MASKKFLLRSHPAVEVEMWEKSARVSLHDEPGTVCHLLDPDGLAKFVGECVAAGQTLKALEIKRALSITEP